MKLRWSVRALAMAALVSGFAASACSKDKTSKVQPKNLGQRGETCQARNDCQTGLACISGTCSRNDFPISVDPRHCDVVQCATDADCCGSRPTEAPPQCADYSQICEQSSFANCVSTSCETDTDCGSGTCSGGLYCSNTSASCASDADCTDTCSGGYCFYDGTACSTDADCPVGTCTGTPYCNCTNPDYDPTDALCSDDACWDICTLKCIEELCVEDTSCESDAECSSSYPFCVGGECVECEEDADCDEDNDEACVSGSCQRPCTVNEECPLFHACVDGDCTEVGCTSDRECVLAYADGTADDARLAKCLPSDEDPDVWECKIPCENDGSCAEFQVCDAGYCKFIGCTTDEECRSYLGLQNQETSELRPYVSRAVCRE